MNTPPPSAAPLAARALAVWLIIIAGESLHGTARVLFLEPVLGDFRARQISVFTGMLLILLVVTLLVRWLRLPTRKQALAIGALWVLLTVVFEVLLGRLVMNLS